MAYSQSPHSQRLYSLMGSDDVKLNDRRYMQKLKKRIKEDHELKLKQREEALALNEVKREKRLILEGILSAPIDQLENAQRRTSERKKRKKRKSSKVSQQGEEFQDANSSDKQHDVSGRSSRLSPRRMERDGGKDMISSGDDEETLIGEQNKESEAEMVAEEKGKPEEEKVQKESVFTALQQEESVSGLYALAEKLVWK